jgi:hypothetical protein
MPFIAKPADLEKALKHIHPRSDGNYINAPADRATNDPGIRYGCVTVVKALAGAPPKASWRRGKKVMGNSLIKPGTAIASFAKLGNGVFLFKGHAAIFHSFANGGIVVYDQWYDPDPVHHSDSLFGKRVIKSRCGGYVSNDAEAFYIIELTQDPSGDSLFCGPTSHAGADD